MKLDDYLNIHSKKHLIFDFDNTLFRLELPWDRWDWRMREDLIDLDAELYGEYERSRTGQTDFVMGLSQLQNEYVLRYGNKALELILENNEQFETVDQTGVSLNDELYSLVMERQEYNYYVWSSNTRKAVIPVLETYALIDRFSTIVTRSDVDLLKPDSEGFERYIHDDKTSLDMYLMIGDSDSDMGAAKSAGIDFFRETYFRDVDSK